MYEETSGRLHLAVSEDAALPWVANLLSMSRKEDPTVLFTIGQRKLNEQLECLRANVMDAGIVSTLSDHPIQIDDEIEAITLGSDPMVLSTRADSPLATRSVIVSLEVGMGPFIILGAHAADAGPIRRLVQRSPADQVAVELAESVEMLFTMAAAGPGVGLVSAALAATVSRPDVVFRPVALKRARVTTYLLVRMQRSAMVERFIERARRMRQSTEA